MRPDAAESDFSLSQKQLSAIPHLLFAPSQGDAAEAAEVHRTILWRWMQDEDFRRELKRQSEEAARLAIAQLQGLTLKAARVLAESLESESPAIRQRAARTLMRMGIDAHDRQTLERHLNKLENAVQLWVSDQTRK